eukprot:jgi/Mesvir1/8185/Mv24076-RA.1
MADSIANVSALLNQRERRLAGSDQVKAAAAHSFPISAKTLDQCIACACALMALFLSSLHSTRWMNVPIAAFLVLAVQSVVSGWNYDPLFNLWSKLTNAWARPPRVRAPRVYLSLAAAASRLARQMRGPDAGAATLTGRPPPRPPPGGAHEALKSAWAGVASEDDILAAKKIILGSEQLFKADKAQDEFRDRQQGGAGPASDRRWRHGIDAPAVEAALDSFVRCIVDEFVSKLWYTSITRDKEGPEEVRRVLNTVMGELARRCKAVDLVPLLTRDMVDLFHQHLQLFRSARARVPGYDALPHDQRDKALREALVASGDLHLALLSPEHEYKLLKRLMEGVVALLLLTKDAQGAIMRILCRELLASVVVGPLVQYASPGWVNELLLLILPAVPSKTTTPPDQTGGMARRWGRASGGWLRSSGPGVFSRTPTAAPHDGPGGAEGSPSQGPVTDGSDEYDDDEYEEDERQMSPPQGGRLGSLLGLTAPAGTSPSRLEMEPMFEGAPHGVFGSAGEGGSEGGEVAKMDLAQHAPGLATRQEDGRVEECLGERDVRASGSPLLGDISRAQEDRAGIVGQGVVRHPAPLPGDLDLPGPQYPEQRAPLADPPKVSSPTSPFGELEDCGVIPLEMLGISPPKAEGVPMPGARNGPEEAQPREDGADEPGMAQGGPEASGQGALAGVGTGLGASAGDSDVGGSASGGDGMGPNGCAVASADAGTGAGGGTVTRAEPEQYWKCTAQISSAEIRGSGMDAHVVYTISIVNDSCLTSWFVDRRYRHFDMLHSRLKALPYYTGRLPPKRTFWDSISPAAVAERCNHLNRFLRDIMADERLARREEVVQFLSPYSAAYRGDPSLSHHIGEAAPAGRDTSASTQVPPRFVTRAVDDELVGFALASQQGQDVPLDDTQIAPLTDSDGAGDGASPALGPGVADAGRIPAHWLLSDGSHFSLPPPRVTQPGTKHSGSTGEPRGGGDEGEGEAEGDEEGPVHAGVAQAERLPLFNQAAAAARSAATRAKNAASAAIPRRDPRVVAAASMAATAAIGPSASGAPGIGGTAFASLRQLNFLRPGVAGGGGGGGGGGSMRLLDKLKSKNLMPGSSGGDGGVGASGGASASSRPPNMAQTGARQIKAYFQEKKRQAAQFALQDRGDGSGRSPPLGAAGHEALSHLSRSEGEAQLRGIVDLAVGMRDATTKCFATPENPRASIAGEKGIRGQFAIGPDASSAHWPKHSASLGDVRGAVSLPRGSLSGSARGGKATEGSLRCADGKGAVQATLPPTLPARVGVATSRPAEGDPEFCIHYGEASAAGGEGDNTMLNVAGPLFDFVDTLFQLRGHAGWIRRKVMWIARQVCEVVLGDTIDGFLLTHIRLISQDKTIAGAITAVQEVLWPGGVYYATPTKVDASTQAGPPHELRPESNGTSDVASVGGSAAAAAVPGKPAAVPGRGNLGSAPGAPPPGGACASASVEPSVWDVVGRPERAAMVRERLVERSHPAITSLVGKKHYMAGVLDVYDLLQSPVFVKQLGLCTVELLLVTAFPELEALLMDAHGIL